METIYVVLKYGSIEVYKSLQESPIVFVFPTAIFNHLEVKDSQAFYKLFNDFIGKTITKGQKVIILLSKAVIFGKMVNQDKIDLAAEKERFLNEVLLENDKIEFRYLIKDNLLFMYATNTDYYRHVLDVLKNYEVKVLSVLPAPAFGIEDDKGNIMVDKMEPIESNLKKFSSLNFINQTNELNFLPVLVAAVVVIVIAVAAYGYFLLKAR